MKNENQFKIGQRVLFRIYGVYTIATIWLMKYDADKKENYCYCISENGNMINGYEHEIITL